MSRFRPALAALALLLPAVLLVDLRAERQETPQRPTFANLDHWIVRADPDALAQTRASLRQLRVYAETKMPDVRLTVWGTEFTNVPDFHVPLESHDAGARAFQSKVSADPEAAEMLAAYAELPDYHFDAYQRLIASDPKKEANVNWFAVGLEVWSLRAHMPLAGRAIECVEALVAHVNENYPNVYARAYEEWTPDPARFHLHFYCQGSIDDWVDTKMAIRRDERFRAIFESASDVFVEGALESYAVTPRR